MAKEVLNINDLSGGINSDLDVKDLKDNEVKDCINFILDIKGKIKPIVGTSISLTKDEIDISTSSVWIYNQLKGFGAFSFNTDFNKSKANVKTTWVVFQSAVNKIAIFDYNNPDDYFEYTLENGLYDFFFARGELYIYNKDFSVDSSIRKWGYYKSSHFKGVQLKAEDKYVPDFTPGAPPVEYEYSIDEISLIKANEVNFNFISLPFSLMESSKGKKAYAILNGILFEATNEGSEYNDYYISIGTVTGSATESISLNGNVINIDIGALAGRTVGHPLSSTLSVLSFLEFFDLHAPTSVKNIITPRALTTEDASNGYFSNIDGLTDEQLSGISSTRGNAYLYDSDSDSDLSDESFTPLSASMMSEINSFDFWTTTETKTIKLSGGSLSLKDLFNSYSNAITVSKIKETIQFETFSGISHGTTSDSFISITKDSKGNYEIENTLVPANLPVYFHPDSQTSVPVLLLYKTIQNSDNPYPKGTYQFLCTYLYSDNSNSTPVYSNFGFSLSESESLQVDIRLAYSNSFKYNSNAIGLKFYIKNLETSEILYFGMIDFNKGFKHHSSEDYVPIKAYNTLDYNGVERNNTLEVNKSMKTGFIDVPRPISYTFKYETGFDADENLNTRFKKAIVSNSRLFAVNTFSDKHYDDRLIISPVNKFSILPENDFIEIVSNDGDEFTTISKFGAKILAFKKNILYIINTSSNDPSTFFLESSHYGAGCTYENAVVSTEFGVFWLNENGLYAYNGQQVINIYLNKLQELHKSFLNPVYYTLGYDEFSKKILIHIKYNSNANAILLYDLKSNGITRVSYSDSPADYGSNVINVNGVPHFFSSFSLFKYNEQLNTSNSCLLETKKYDFGQPHVRKKIRRFYAHFIGNLNLNSVTFEYRIDDESYQTITSEIQVSGNLIMFDLPRSITAYTIQLKITGVVTFEISDISIIYRRKLPK